MALNKQTKSIVIVLLTSMWMGVSLGQQDPQYTMYMFNPLTVNPGYAGSRDALSATLIARKQWVGIKGAPETVSFTAHTPLKNEAIGVGLSFTQDKIGPTSNSQITGDVSYKLQVTPSSKLSFGIKAGADIYTANFVGTIVNDPNDILYQTPIQGKLMPNFGAGAYWYTNESYVGLTAPKLLENTYSGALVASTGKPARQNRHYFLTAGHSLKINSMLDVIPSFVAKAVQDAPVSLDLNVNFLFYERLWLGLGHRFGDSFLANVVFHFSPTFRAGYAFDYTVSDLGSYNSGSHEIMLNYDLDFLGKGFKTPRRF